MPSEEEVLAKMLSGDRQGALELIKARMAALGEDASLRERIKLAWVTGDLPGAAELAIQWMVESPDETMAPLSLGETFQMGGTLEEALEILQQAQRIKWDHPMYMRLVFLCAKAAKAYTAANGALFYACVSRLPELILNDLRAEGVYRQLGDSLGEYPEEENLDPRWLHLLPQSWHPESLPVHLTWDRVNGCTWIFNAGLLDAAVAASKTGSHARWADHPEAAEIARERVRLYTGKEIEDCEIEPWMCASWQGLYLLGALAQYGFPPKCWPKVDDTDTELIKVDRLAANVGWGASSGPGGPGTEAWTRVETNETAEMLASLMPATFNGWVTLSGPDNRITEACEWLTGNLPEHARRFWRPTLF